jgi:hypothetical protein
MKSCFAHASDVMSIRGCVSHRIVKSGFLDATGEELRERSQFCLGRDCCAKHHRHYKRLLEIEPIR